MAFTLRGVTGRRYFTTSIIQFFKNERITANNRNTLRVPRTRRYWAYIVGIVSPTISTVSGPPY